MSCKRKRKRCHSWPLPLSEDEEFKSFLFPSDEMSSSGTKRRRILEPNHVLELVNIMRGIMDENIIEWDGFKEDVLCIKLNEHCGSFFTAEQVLDEIKRLKNQYDNRFDRVLRSTMVNSLGKKGWDNFVFVFAHMKSPKESEPSVPGTSQAGSSELGTGLAATSETGTSFHPKTLRKYSFKAIKERLSSLNLPPKLVSFAISRADIPEFQLQLMSTEGRDNVINFLNLRKKVCGMT